MIVSNHYWFLLCNSYTITMNKEYIDQVIIDEIKHYNWDDCMEAFYTIFCPSEIEYIEKMWMTDSIMQKIQDFISFS